MRTKRAGFVRLSGFAAAAFAALIILSVSGCGTVQYDAFAEFAATARDLREGTDAALAVPAAWSRDRYIEEKAVASTDSAAVEEIVGLVLVLDPKAFGWSMTEPLPPFMVHKRFREGFYTLNTALVEYAELLDALSTLDLGREEFELQAHTLNASFRDAARAVGDTSSAEGIALFSTAAIEISRQYLDDHKRTHLKEAIAANQSPIEEASDCIRGGLRIALRELCHEYEVRAQALRTDLHPHATISLAERRRRVEKLVALNEEMIDRLSALRVLDESYGELPAANRELAASLDDADFNLQAIRDIAANATLLQALYRELSLESDASNP